MVFLKAFLLINLFFVVLNFLPHVKLKGQDISILSFGLNFCGYLLLLVLFYSSFKTIGNTVLITILPVAFWWIYVGWKKIEFRFWPSKVEFSYLCKVLIIVNFIFVFKALCSFQFSGEYLKIITNDYLFYAKVSSFIHDRGIETAFLSDFAFVHPYHYFELWLNSIFIDLGLSPYPALILVTYPIILSFCFGIGFLVFDSSDNSKKALLFAVAILLVQLFCIPWLLDRIPFLLDAKTFLINTGDAPKLSIIYLVFLLSLLGYRYRKLNLFLWVFTIAPALYGTLVFGTVGVLGAALILKVYDRKSISWTPIVFLALSIVLFQGFYRVNHYQSDLLPIFNASYFKTLVNVIAGTLVRIGIIILPYLILIFLVKKSSIVSIISKHSLLITLVFLSGSSSLLAWACFHTQLDSVQFFTNFSIPFLCIGLAYLLYLIDYRVALFSFLIIITFSYKKYFYINTFESTKSCEALFTKMDNGVFLKDVEDYKDPFLINPYCSNPLSNSFLVNRNIKMYDLSLIDVDKSSNAFPATINIYLKSNELVDFAAKKQMTGLPAKVAFIKENCIQFLICPKSYNVPTELSVLFSKRSEIESSVIWYR